MTIDVIQLAMGNKVMLFQLPFHSSHVTQPLDECDIVILKRKSTETLQGWQRMHGNEISVKYIFMR